MNGNDRPTFSPSPIGVQLPVDLIEGICDHGYVMACKVRHLSMSGVCFDLKLHGESVGGGNALMGQVKHARMINYSDWVGIFCFAACSSSYEGVNGAWRVFTALISFHTAFKSV